MIVMFGLIDFRHVPGQRGLPALRLLPIAPVHNPIAHGPVARRASEKENLRHDAPFPVINCLPPLDTG
jgi:hypothetical protein